MKSNVKDLSKEQFTSYLKEHSQPSYRAAQVWQWLYQKRAVSFDEMSNLSGALRRQLAADFSISRPRIARQSESRDGTVKFLFELADGATIESVLIPESHRLTLCISTQAGCGLDNVPQPARPAAGKAAYWLSTHKTSPNGPGGETGVSRTR